MYRFYGEPGLNRVTVAGEFQNGVLRMAVSRSSVKDRFTRKRGAGIAEGRLRKGKTIAEIPMDHCNGADFVRAAQAIILAVKADGSLVHGDEKIELEFSQPNPELAIDGIGD